jgi:hypothetical protein
MASKTARAVQVPGEPTTAAPETETEQTPEVVVADGAAEPNAADLVNDEVAQLRAQLEA